MNDFLMVIGLLAFVVSAIVEVIKNVKVLKGIPTDLVVIVLSLVLTVASFFAYASYTQLVVIWYMVIAAIIIGFLVAFVAMYGWTKLTDLYKRFER